MYRFIAKNILPNFPKFSRCTYASHSVEGLDERYEEYFNRREIDAWEIRKAMNDLAGMDAIPEPKVISAALKACRRLDDYALAIRWLETCYDKCGAQKKVIWPYLVQEIQDTLDELGIETPEELGYDKPELALKSVIEVERETANQKYVEDCPKK